MWADLKKQGKIVPKPYYKGTLFLLRAIINNYVFTVLQVAQYSWHFN